MVLLFVVLISAVIGYIGRYRILGFWGHFLLSVILGPLIGALVVALSQDMRPRA